MEYKCAICSKKLTINSIESLIIKQHLCKECLVLYAYKLKNVKINGQKIVIIAWKNYDYLKFYLEPRRSENAIKYFLMKYKNNIVYLFSKEEIRSCLKKLTIKNDRNKIYLIQKIE